MQLLKSGLERIFSGLISPTLWAFAIVASLLLELVFLYSEASGWAEAIYLIVGLSAFVGMIVAQWKMTRALGEAAADDVGSVGAWIGWSLVAYLPAIILLFTPMAMWGVDGYYTTLDAAPWWLPTVVIIFSTALIVPVSVHAAGRAINADGPSLGNCFKACGPIYLPLAISFLIASGAFFLASEWLIEISRTQDTALFYGLFAISSSFCTLAAFVWSTAIVTLVWRAVEKREQVQA